MTTEQTAHKRNVGLIQNSHRNIMSYFIKERVLFLPFLCEEEKRVSTGKEFAQFYEYAFIATKNCLFSHIHRQNKYVLQNIVQIYGV